MGGQLSLRADAFYYQYVALLTRPIVGHTAALMNRLGLGAVNRRIKRLIERTGHDTVTVSSDGLRVAGPVSAVRTLAQIADGTYERTEIALFRRSLRPGSVVVDIGAHVGYYTLVAARDVGETGHVFAFEPDPRTSPYIGANARDNGFANVTVIPAAASDAASTRTMYLSPNANRSSLYQSATLDGVDAMTTVDALAVDDVLEGTAVDVVKIDAEGSEPEVMRGLQGSLKPESIVFMEFNPPVLESASVDFREFGQWLFSRFRRIEQIDAAGATPIERPPEGFANLRCSGWHAAGDR